jgi:hypothetical protein
MTSIAILARSLMVAVAVGLVVAAGVFAQGVDVAEPPSSASTVMTGGSPSTPSTTEPVVSLPTVERGSGGSGGSTAPDETDCPPEGGRSLVGCDSDVSDPG